VCHKERRRRKQLTLKASVNGKRRENLNSDAAERATEARVKEDFLKKSRFKCKKTTTTCPACESC
jgi:hypothetical protein